MKSDITRFDQISHFWCPMLGQPMVFGYCRKMNQGLPCHRVLTCFSPHFDIEYFLESHFDAQQMKRILAPAKGKMDRVAEALAQAEARKAEKKMSSLSVVVENTSLDSKYSCEHGLSLWLNHQGRQLLYDTGAGVSLLPNLRAMNLDPLTLECVVLSHGHYDHTGGLTALLRLRRAAGLQTAVYCHGDVFARHLKQDGSTLKVLAPEGHDPDSYEALGAVFHFVDGTVEVFEGVTLLAPIERKTDFEGPAPGLVTMENGKVVPDPLWDDLAMIVETRQGLSVITGCAHSGVVNVLLAVEKLCGRGVDLLVGGTHLGPAPEAQQEKALEYLGKVDSLKIAAGHCTGAEMQKRMAGILGDRFLGLAGGMVLEL